MSLPSVELWRPRPDPKRRARRILVGVLALALLIGSLVAAAITRRPLVLGVGLAVAFVLACAWGWLLARETTWGATRPRPWVPRVPGDHRAWAGADRRGPTRARRAPLSIAPAPCNSQPDERRLAIGGSPPV